MRVPVARAASASAASSIVDSFQEHLQDCFGVWTVQCTLCMHIACSFQYYGMGQVIRFTLISWGRKHLSCRLVLQPHSQPPLHFNLGMLGTHGGLQSCGGHHLCGEHCGAVGP